MTGEIVAGIAAVLTAGLTGWFGYSRGVKKDSGDLTLRTLVVLNERQDKVLSQLESRCQYLETELQGMRMQNVELHAELAAVKAENREQQQELSELKQQNKELRAENMGLRGRLQKLETEPKKHEAVVGI